MYIVFGQYLVIENVDFGLFVLIHVVCVCCRLQDTPQHTHLQTVDGMKPQAGLRAVKLQGLLPVPACGTPLPVTLQQGLPPLAGIHLATLHLAMVEPQEVYGRTAGMKPPKLKERPQDMEVAGQKRHAQTEEMSQWVRLLPQVPVRGSHAGMKLLLVKWDPQHPYLPQEKLPSEHQP